MHTVPQNKDKFTINNLFYCCKARIFTHPLVYEFLCGLIFMGHPVDKEMMIPAESKPYYRSIKVALRACKEKNDVSIFEQQESRKMLRRPF